MLAVVLAMFVAAGLGLLGWTVLQQSGPAVSGRISVWEVRSDHKVSFTLTVDRQDPQDPGACRVIAQAKSHRTVGELTVRVPPSGDRSVDTSKTIRTLHRATSVSLDKCWSP